MAKRIRESIAIEKKYQIIKLVEKKEKYTTIMNQFNLKIKANISVVMKQKEEIIKVFEVTAKENHLKQQFMKILNRI